MTAGDTAPVFLGGSNLAIPTNSENQDLALDLLKIMVSPEYQRQFAGVRHDPGAQVGARQRRRQRRRRRPGDRRAEQPLRADQRELGRRRGSQRAARHAGRDRPGRRHRRRRGDGRRRDRGAAQRLDSRSVNHQTPHITYGLSRWLCCDACTRGRRPDHLGSPPRAARRRSSALPYWLLLPSIAVLVRDARLPALPPGRAVAAGVRARRRCSASRPTWVGLDNFREILTERYFWTVLWRTLIFCAVNVALTMVLGVLIALLLQALGKKMRLLVSTSLILAWAMPALTATVVWQWIFDTQYGLVNWALVEAGALLARRAACRSSWWRRSSSCGWASRSSPSPCTPG